MSTHPPSELKIAVASVQLLQDCSDPPEPVAAKDDPSAAEQAGSVDPAFKGPGFTQPCTQSTVQLSLTNNGTVPGKLQILTIRLLDAATQRELGTLVGRKPSVWTDEGTYQPWDETVREGAAAMTVAYRLADPDWSQVQASLGPDINLFARRFMLELEFKVDGVTQTVRSPEFMRQEPFLVVT